MKIELKNIGSIEHSIIDLDKNLIVFTGGNNSGKTYVSYCLYGLSKFSPAYENDILDEILDTDFSELLNNGSEEIDLSQIAQHLDLIEKEYAKQFKKYLPILFGMDSDHFINTDVKLKLGSIEEFVYYLKNFHFQLGGTNMGGVGIIFEKKANDTKLLLTLNYQATNETKIEVLKKFNSLNKRNILEYTISPFTKFGVTFLPAERIGISIFSKELFLNRFSSTNEILELDELNRNKVVNLLNSNFNRYSQIIQDSLKTQENLSKLKVGKVGEFGLLADELEEKILKGKLTIDEYGDVNYKSKGQILKIQATGSMIKSLASLVFFLRYQAYKGYVLIMDEPEINLHPINQRIIAKVLAKISNMGIKVIISTHSDYIIRELNNLIMLDNKNVETQLLLKKYDYSETEVLNKNNVDAYYFSGSKTDKIEVTETGFEVEAIDDTIALQNKATSEIKWTLFED